MVKGGNGNEDIQRRARVLVDQAVKLVRELKVDVSNAERLRVGSVELRKVAYAYERLACAQKKVDAILWERTVVDGRDGDYLMKSLWEVREALRRDQQHRPAKS